MWVSFTLQVGLLHLLTNKGVIQVFDHSSEIQPWRQLYLNRTRWSVKKQSKNTTMHLINEKKTFVYIYYEPGLIDQMLFEAGFLVFSPSRKCVSQAEQCEQFCGRAFLKHLF